jgi:RHS repeat-associated protein
MARQLSVSAISSASHSSLPDFRPLFIALLLTAFLCLTHYPLAQVAGGALTYLHTDGTGSVIAQTSPTGAVLDRYGYGAYGESATTAGVLYRYAGRRLDPETGLYYNRARMYSAKLGRFLQPDPSGTADGANLYAYTNNDPVNKTDPSGRFAQGVESGAYETFFGSYDTRFLELMSGGNTANRVGGAVGFAAGFAGNLGIEVVSALALDGVLRGVGVAGVQTPYGIAKQSQTASALAARTEVSNGTTLYRVGTTGRSQTSEAQFWSLEHPLSSGYAQRYGLPTQNVQNANFIEAATLKPGTSFVTRTAPAVGTNQGGGIEAVVPSGGVQMKWFAGTP